MGDIGGGLVRYVARGLGVTETVAAQRIQEARERVSQGTVREGDVCPSCGGVGWVRPSVPVEHPDFGKATPCPTCKPAKPRLSLDTFIPRCALHWQDPLDGCKGCLEVATAVMVARKFTTESWPRWVILLGSYGCGKTALARLMVTNCGETYRCIESGEFLQEVYSTMGQPAMGPDGIRNRSEQDVMRFYAEAPALLLDELGRESQTEASKNRISTLLNNRYASQLRTVITSNLPAAEIAATWPNLWSRMQDKSVGLVVPMWNVVDARPYLRPLPKETL